MARLSRRDYARAGFLRPSDPLPGDPPWPWRHMMDMTPEEVAAFLATDPLGDVVDDSSEACERLVQDLNAAMDQEAARQETVTPGNPRPDYWRTPSVFDHAILDLSQVRAKPISWPWPGRIPFGKVTILDGDPGLGKSTLLLDLAARLTTARPFPDQETAHPESVVGPEPVEGPRVPSPSAARFTAARVLPDEPPPPPRHPRDERPQTRDLPSSVLLLSAEDDLADTIRPRLEVAGADLSRVVTVPFLPTGYGQRMVQLPGDIPTLTWLAIHTGAVLLVVDPFIAFLNTKININDDHRLRHRLAPLVLLAERANLAVVLVRHLTKRAARTPLHLGRGAVGLGGLARAGLLVAPDPNDASGQRRVLATTKSNLGPMPPALAYRLVTAPNGAAAIQWEGPVQLTATDLTTPRSGRDLRAHDALQEATTVLASILADRPLPANEVRRQAAQAGLNPGLLWRAKLALGIRSHKVGGRGPAGQSWLWALADQPAPRAGSKQVELGYGLESRFPD
jgi:putative DNA primase/helicase